MQHPITEIFSSIQGEGPYIEHPTVFIRYSGCNLRCKWGNSYCDTPYSSWEPEKTMMETDEIIHTVETLNGTFLQNTPKHPHRICITGGEPTMHKGLTTLCKALKEWTQEHSLQLPLDIETNGTGPIPREIDTIVCSPKLSDSTPIGTEHEINHELLRMKLHPILHGSDSRLYLKFVVTEITPLKEISDIVATLSCPPERVYLMPEGTTKETLLTREPMVKALAKELGYNYSTRLHVMLWGDKRGI